MVEYLPGILLRIDPPNTEERGSRLRKWDRMTRRERKLLQSEKVQRVVTVLDTGYHLVVNNSA